MKTYEPLLKLSINLVNELIYHLYASKQFLKLKDTIGKIGFK